MKIFVSSLAISLIIFFLVISLGKIRSWMTNYRQNKIKKRDSAVRGYLQNFKEGEKLAIIDETPREVFIGDRFYLLKPLKYRQYTRLCILFAKTLQKLQEKGIAYENADNLIGIVTENVEDDFFRAVAIVLFFSNNQNEVDEKKVFEGMQKEYDFIKENATVDQISRILEIIMIQNDIERALKAFGLASKKKMGQPS